MRRGGASRRSVPIEKMGWFGPLSPAEIDMRAYRKALRSRILPGHGRIIAASIASFLLGWLL